MATFEKVFGTPREHTLKETYFKSSAGGSRDYWKHEEYDEQGILVARYESWMNLTINGLSTDAGWKKISPTGEIVAIGDDLPI